MTKTPGGETPWHLKQAVSKCGECTATWGGERSVGGVAALRPRALSRLIWHLGADAGACLAQAHVAAGSRVALGRLGAPGARLLVEQVL